MTLRLRYTVRTDVGLIRDGNEDCAYAGPHLLAIADGMGGHAAGEVASGVAIATLAPLDADTTGTDMLKSLADAIARANESLRRITLSEPSTEGMGTTLTAMLWSDDQIALCHIGDSRAYLMRDGELRQITHDHTLVQSLVDEGRLTPEAAANHPKRSLVLRALQSSVPANPDLTMLTARAGDRYLLCSDGLSDVVTSDTIGKTLADLPDLDEAVAQLIDLAIRAGGPDNITCVLAEVIDAGAAGADPTEDPIIVGALLTDDDAGTAQRSDSPAARASLLSRGLLPAAGSGRDAEDTSPDLAGLPLTVPDPSGTVSGAGTRDDAAVAEDDADAEDEGPGRRRWPIVTSALIVLFAVIGGAGYLGWHITQNEYFVGTQGGKVAIFRGVNETVAGIHLSSVTLATNIPLGQIPTAEAGQIQATIAAENMAEARQIVARIRQDYRCGLVETDIQRWAASKPKPSPTPTRSAAKSRRTAARPGGAKGTARAVTSTRSAAKSAPAKHVTLKASAPAQPPYPPKPVLPAYCASSLGGAG
ncbi:MAG: PP2C family protein-serine/threonine phosphatase [Streptosporangiaceae bacterium]